MLNIPQSQGGLQKRLSGTNQRRHVIYLARHGWHKLMPRPFHPNADVAAQKWLCKTAFQMLWGKTPQLPPAWPLLADHVFPMKRGRRINPPRGRARPQWYQARGRLQLPFAIHLLLVQRGIPKNGTYVYLIMPHRIRRARAAPRHSRAKFARQMFSWC